MNIKETKPPRAFTIGLNKDIEVLDCAHIELKDNEQVTFISKSGTEYDVVKKSWGYYATPSLNSRLNRFHLRPALVSSSEGKHFIHFVENGKEKSFEEYLEKEKHRVICWLDDDQTLEKIDKATHE